MTLLNRWTHLLFGILLVACSPEAGLDWEEPADYVFSMNAYCDQPVHGRFIVTVSGGDVTDAIPVERSAETFLDANGVQAVPTLSDIVSAVDDVSDISVDDSGIPTRVRSDADDGGQACFDILAFSIPLPDEELRSVYSQTITQLCADAQRVGGCAGQVEVSEKFDAGFGASLLPMPTVVRETIEAELPTAVFSDAAGRDEGTLRLLIGPYELVRDGVVRVEAGYLCGSLCGSGRVWYFAQVDGVWQPTTAGAVGEQDSRWEA